MRADSNVIHNREKMRQLIDYSGMQRGGIYPSDIDGCLEYKNRAYIFLEYKYNESPLPGGQKIMYQRLCDDLTASGKPACVLLCSHDVKDERKDIDAARAFVVAIYFRGKWIACRRYTVAVWVEKFLDWVDVVNSPPFN